MVKIDLKRIVRMQFLGTYKLEKNSSGGALPHNIDIIGRTVSMYIDCELQPTTHFIINDGDMKMYMRHSAVSRAYTSWEPFEAIP